MRATVGDVLEQAAARTPDKIAYTFVDAGAARAVTYAELNHRAAVIASRLREHMAVGDRALLVFGPGLEFVEALFGCLYAGVTVVPASLPWHPGGYVRLEHVISLADVRQVVTSVSVGDRARRRLNQRHGSSLQWLETDAIVDAPASAPGPRVTTPIAAIQFSSGSTALPRGACLTHENILSNAEAIRQVAGHGPDSVIVSWLPHHHDMGLFGAIVQSAFAGAHCVLLSPATFLRHPVRWLEAISTYRGTSSGAPNFAYDHCVRAIPSGLRAGLDLASWRMAFNGSEPVRAATMRRFADAFEPHGFRASAFCPCYGLAESTLLVAAADEGRAWVTAQPARSLTAAGLDVSTLDGTATDVTSCGRPRGGQRVIIVDPESREECQAGDIGEIWVTGPSVAQSYWGDTDATSATFGARLADGRGPFLRTGDLGFVQGEELFIAGRLKDMLIVRGQKHAAEDVEWAASQSHRALAGLSLAAFAIDEGHDVRVVLMCERPAVTVDPDTLVGTMRQAVNESTGLLLHTVSFVERGRMPKTTSGKVQRHRCRRQFLDARGNAADPAVLSGVGMPK